MLFHGSFGFFLSDDELECFVELGGVELSVFVSISFSEDLL